MSWLPKLLRTKEIVSFTFRRCRSACVLRRDAAKIIQLFSTTSSVSGYFIGAGCCFSKQEEAAFPTDSETSVTRIENKSLANVSETQPLLSEMKRNAESLAEPELVETLTRNESSMLLEPASKKIKVQDYAVVPTVEKDEQFTCKKSTDISLENQIVQTNEPESSKKIKKKKNKREKAKVLSPVAPSDPTDVPKKEKEKSTKQRPNYFVAIQVSNDQVIRSMKLVQDHILEKEKKLIKSMTSLQTLHITLMVMYIANQESYDRALEALQNVHDEFNKDLSQNPLQIEFQGLSHFGNRVLYAKVSNNEAADCLMSLAVGVRKHFANHAFQTNEQFTPHMTVAKIVGQNCKGVKKIDPILYEKFMNDFFGSQVVKSIQLCKMTGPKNEDGYYSNEEIFFSGFSPKERLEALKKSLSIEEQKKDVQEKIKSLLKDKIN